MYHAKITQGKETLKTEVKLTDLKIKSLSKTENLFKHEFLTPFHSLKKNHALILLLFSLPLVIQRD